MSSALQVALFLASMAVFCLVLLLIPLLILFYLEVKRIARQMDEAKSDLKAMIQDFRTMVQDISRLSTHANQQLDELDKIVGMAGKWSEQADYFVEEVGSMVKLPVLKALRTVKILGQTWRLILGALGGSSPQTDHKVNDPAGTDPVRK
jgi:predicted PurR-regulated permease PerM